MNMEASEKSEQIDLMAEAFRKVLSEGAPEGEAQRAILIKRIPIICNDIIEIKSKLQVLVWLACGLLTGVGLLALKQLGV